MEWPRLIFISSFSEVSHYQVFDRQCPVETCPRHNILEKYLAFQFSFSQGSRGRRGNGTRGRGLSVVIHNWPLCLRRAIGSGGTSGLIRAGLMKRRSRNRDQRRPQLNAEPEGNRGIISSSRCSAAYRNRVRNSLHKATGIHSILSNCLALQRAPDANILRPGRESSGLRAFSETF